MSSAELLQKTQAWLRDQACPLWLEKGLDVQGGGFYESFSLQGEPLAGPRRVMVQARQIFSAHLAMERGFLSREQGHRAMRSGIDFVLRHYSLPSGAFAHAVDEKFRVITDKPADLYAQSFALFGLARAYRVFGEAAHKERARELVQYLRRERRLPQGGYSELGPQGVLFEANPHMHLFEAALYWMEIDADPLWRDLSDEICELSLRHFVDQLKFLLAEHFDVDWNPLREEDGRYVFEPGHHYEWVWLYGRYQKMTGQNLMEIRHKLYDIAELYGLFKERGAAYDEVGSDLVPKKRSSRFWPQCERIKAALQMGLEVADKKDCARAADEALECLFRFLSPPQPGLWYDLWLENGEFQQQPAKASSFYHIIGAMDDYLELRRELP